MRKPMLAVIALSLSFTGVAMANQLKPDLSKRAKVSMMTARKIALKAYPGKIIKQELEKESGGSGLRYSFDIKSAKATHEVGVDAKNGKVLENSVEGADND
ncbi:MAG: PepSY domain-containing protein [Rhodanobacter sp.]